MKITIVSYPRSGRHRLASMLPAFSNWRVKGKPMTLVSCGLFVDMVSSAGFGGIERDDSHGQCPLLPHIKDYIKREDGKIYISAIHKRPDEVPGFKIIPMRDPREVAISYAKWWAKSTGNEKNQEEFLSDWILYSSRYAREKWRANVVDFDWEQWARGLDPSDPALISFYDIKVGPLWLWFQSHGIDADISGSPVSLDGLRAFNPAMFHRGRPCLEELPEELRGPAWARWGELINKFRLTPEYQMV